jgi:CRP/FNR family transcriptional regulator
MNSKTYSDELPFAEYMSAEEKKLAESSITVRSYSKGSVLYANSGECLGFISIMKGRVRTILISPEGREVTLYRLSEGDVDVLSAFCVLSRITFRTQMVAETDCEVMMVPPSVLSQLKEDNPGVKGWIYDRLMDRFSEVMHVMEQILFSRVDQRMARFLLDRYEETGERTITITQEQIAQGINSVREVVARTIKPLEKENILVVSRGKITIKDINALEDLSKGMR